MAMAADTVIVEVEEIVEVGELGPEEIDVPAPVIDMIYERTGENDQCVQCGASQSKSGRRSVIWQD